jgi:hypothetical protein
MNQSAQYQSVANKPIGCTFCGATVQGKVNQSTNPKTKQIVKECRWVCSRCNNLVKIGNVG